MSEKDPKCPRCIDEKLVKTLGNILVCPSCEIQVVIKSEPVELPPETE
jgi:hypothetical protein